MAATTNEPQRLSRRKRFLFAATICFVIVIVFVFASELVLRLKVGPWRSRSAATLIVVDPLKPYYRADAALGYLPVPGSFKITLPGPYSFRITHAENGLRITRPADIGPATEKGEIWIFGCSFTEGWTLNDEQSYPWLLQSKIKNYQLVNYGVSGYGTLQSLIQFQQALKSGKKPALAVLSYASFHDRRNTLARSWMKTRMTYGPVAYLSDVKLPYMKWSAAQKPELLYRPIEYREVPLARYSALANTLDETLNRIIDQTYHSHEVSKSLIEDFAQLCQANQIDFVVAGITSDAATADMLEYCQSRGMTIVDISVDLDIPENNNLPYDNHPSAVANRQYAQKLWPVICARLVDEPSCAQR
jgi:hypothetical protein